MSTLTKVLVVLLTVFSIFLCGIVVTYVAHAENQRGRANDLDRQLQSARQRRDAAIASEEEHKKEVEALKADLGKQVADLNVLKGQLDAQIDGLKRENAQLVQKLTDMAAVVATANETLAKVRDQSAVAEQEVKNLRADQADRSKELEETTQALMERTAVIADLQRKSRQLIEEKQGLETQLNQVLQQYGKAPARPRVVTAQRSIAQPVQPQTPTPVMQTATKDIGLNGRVTQVDMKNHVAAISIGSAAGVREEMKFHVTRGDRYICDILIFDVDAEKAIGVLDLIQTEPQAGDLVATNL